MFGLEAALATMMSEQAIIRHAKETMTPEAFAEWRRERIEARRHAQLCRAIRDSRPRGIGLFW